ncbi:MAG: class I SAM-dependent methyltransferase [Pseudomonadota bacterium]
MSLFDAPPGKKLRYLRLMLDCLRGRGGGFFIPYRYADGVPIDAPIAPHLHSRFAQAQPRMANLLAQMATYRDGLSAIKRDAPAPEPRWGQDWFPGLDAAAYYTLIRQHQPQRIVEIGSGHSTRFAVQAIRDQGLNTKIHAIDPAPRAAITQALAETVTWHRMTVETIPPDQRPVLAAGDILFIDSSHILMPGTDVDCLFHDWLPSLPAGVLVHIHDIFLPAPYPRGWRWRGYNEQPLVASLLGTQAYELIFASAYLRAEHPADMSELDPVIYRPEEAIESSLWLRKNDGM